MSSKNRNIDIEYNDLEQDQMMLPSPHASPKTPRILRDIVYETHNPDFDFTIVFMANPRSGSGRANKFLRSVR